MVGLRQCVVLVDPGQRQSLGRNQHAVEFDAASAHGQGAAEGAKDPDTSSRSANSRRTVRAEFPSRAVVSATKRAALFRSNGGRDRRGYMATGTLWLRLWGVIRHEARCAARKLGS